MTSLAQTQADDVLSFTFRIKADINAEHKVRDVLFTLVGTLSKLMSRKNHETYLIVNSLKLRKHLK